jgi:TRAP transporter TAXI family solute receptor
MAVLRFFCAAAVAAMLAPAAQAQTISIGTSPVGSLNNSLGTALGKVMTEVAGLRTRVVPFGGGQQFLPLIDKGELEMALPASNDAVFAYRGEGDFQGAPSPRLRAIGTVFPFTIGWYVKKESPYQSLADLKGKKIAVGFTANSAQRRVFQATLGGYGVAEQDFDGVPVPHVVRGADDFMQGKVEASLFAVGAGKMQEVNSKVGIRFLNMPDTPAALAGIRKFLPISYVATLEPAPAFAGVNEPTKLLFEDYVVVASAQMAEEDAYKIAKLLYEAQDKLAAIARTFERYNRADLAADRGVPFHPGAIRFYKEVGIWKGS